MYSRAAAAVRILLPAFGMARFIFALSSELMDDGIIEGGTGSISRQEETLDALFASSELIIDFAPCSEEVTAPPASNYGAFEQMR